MLRNSAQTFSMIGTGQGFGQRGISESQQQAGDAFVRGLWSGANESDSGEGTVACEASPKGKRVSPRVIRKHIKGKRNHDGVSLTPTAIPPVESSTDIDGSPHTSSPGAAAADDVVEENLVDPVGTWENIGQQGRGGNATFLNTVTGEVRHESDADVVSGAPQRQQSKPANDFADGAVNSAVVEEVAELDASGGSSLDALDAVEEDICAAAVVPVATHSKPARRANMRMVQQLMDESMTDSADDIDGDGSKLHKSKPIRSKRAHANKKRSKRRKKKIAMTSSGSPVPSHHPKQESRVRDRTTVRPAHSTLAVSVSSYREREYQRENLALHKLHCTEFERELEKSRWQRGPEPERKPKPNHVLKREANFDTKATKVNMETLPKFEAVLESNNVRKRDRSASKHAARVSRAHRRRRQQTSLPAVVATPIERPAWGAGAAVAPVRTSGVGQTGSSGQHANNEMNGTNVNFGSLFVRRLRRLAARSRHPVDVTMRRMFKGASTDGYVAAADIIDVCNTALALTPTSRQVFAFMNQLQKKYIVRSSVHGSDQARALPLWLFERLATSVSASPKRSSHLAHDVLGEKNDTENVQIVDDDDGGDGIEASKVHDREEKTDAKDIEHLLHGEMAGPLSSMIAAIAGVVETFSPERRGTDGMEEPSSPALSLEQGSRKDAENNFIREGREQHDLTSKHSSDCGSVLVELPDVDRHSSSGASSTNDSDGTTLVAGKRSFRDAQYVEVGDSKSYADEDCVEDVAHGNEGHGTAEDGRDNGENASLSAKGKCDNSESGSDCNDEDVKLDGEVSGIQSTDEVSGIQTTEVQALAQLHALKRSLQARTDDLELNFSQATLPNTGRNTSQDVSVQTSPATDLLEAAPVAADVEWARNQLEYEVSQEPKHEVKSDASSGADQQVAPETTSEPSEQEQQHSDVDQLTHQEPQSTSNLPEQQHVHLEAVAMTSKVEGNQRTQDIATHSFCRAREGVSVGIGVGATSTPQRQPATCSVSSSSTLTEQEAVDTTLDVPQRMDFPAPQNIGSPPGQQQPTQYSISLRNSNMHIAAVPTAQKDAQSVEQTMPQQQQRQPTSYSISLAHGGVENVAVKTLHDAPCAAVEALPSLEARSVLKHDVCDAKREVKAATSATDPLRQNLSPCSTSDWPQHEGHINHSQGSVADAATSGSDDQEQGLSVVRNSGIEAVSSTDMAKVASTFSQPDDTSVSTKFNGTKNRSASRRWQMLRAEVRSGKFARGGGNGPVRVAEGHCMMYNTASRLMQGLEPKVEQGTTQDMNADPDGTCTSIAVTPPTREPQDLVVAEANSLGNEERQRRSVRFSDSPSPTAPSAVSSGENKTFLRLRELEKRHSLKQDSTTNTVTAQGQPRAMPALHPRSQNSSGRDSSQSEDCANDTEGCANDIAAMKSEIARVSFAGSTPPMRRSSHNRLSASPALGLSPKAREYRKELLQGDDVNSDNTSSLNTTGTDFANANREPMEEETVAKSIATHDEVEIVQRKCTPPLKRASVRFSTPSPAASTETAMDVDTMNSSSALDLLPPLAHSSSPTRSSPENQAYAEDFDMDKDSAGEESAQQEYEDDFDDFEDPVSDQVAAQVPFWQTKVGDSGGAERHVNLQADMSSDEEFGLRKRRPAARAKDTDSQAAMKVVVYAAANPAHRKRLVVQRQTPWNSFLEKVCTVLTIPQPSDGVNIVVQDEEVGADVTDTADIMPGDELAVAVIREAIEAPSQSHRVRRVRKSTAQGSGGARKTDSSHTEPSVMQSVSLPRFGAAPIGNGPSSNSVVAAGHTLSGRVHGETRMSIDPLPLSHEKPAVNASVVTEAVHNRKSWNDGFGRRRGPRPARERNLRLKKRGPTNEFGIELAYGNGAARPTARMGLAANYSGDQNQQTALSGLESLVLVNMRKLHDHRTDLMSMLELFDGAGIGRVSTQQFAASVARLRLGIGIKVVEVIAQVAAGHANTVNYIKFFKQLGGGDLAWVVDGLRAPFEQRAKKKPKPKARAKAKIKIKSRSELLPNPKTGATNSGQADLRRLRKRIFK